MKDFLFGLARPVLMGLDAEAAHRATIAALKLAPELPLPMDPEVLHVSAFGLDFPNPVGLAAGFDKNAEVANALFGLGFGFVEVGAVTPRPQPGNPRPRAFRLVADEAVINRYGFNSEGLDVVADRLASLRPRGILGVNLGANKDSADRAADYETLVRRLAGHCAFLTANVSSPNTPGLRSMQSRAPLDDLLRRVVEARDAACEGRDRTPLLVKIAPDVSDEDLDDIVTVARDRKVDGMIVSNTTIARPADLTDQARAKETGGLSGRPLFRPSTIVLAKVAQRVDGAFPLIGVGGIDSGQAALAKIRAGATLLQLYTALVFKGPGLVAAIKRDLAAEIRRQSLGNLSALVGSSRDDIAAGRF